MFLLLHNNELSSGEGKTTNQITKCSRLIKLPPSVKHKEIIYSYFEVKRAYTYLKSCTQWDTNFVCVMGGIMLKS